jgi:hypothetical protein
MILRRSGNERWLNALDGANARRVESGGPKKLSRHGEHARAAQRHGRVFHWAWQRTTIVKARLRTATNIISTGKAFAGWTIAHAVCVFCFTVRLAAAAAYTHVTFGCCFLFC